MATEATRAALFNALAWLDAKKKDAGVDTENVEVGVQCLRCGSRASSARADQQSRALADTCGGGGVDLSFSSLSMATTIGCCMQRGVRRERARRAAQAGVRAAWGGLVRGRVRRGCQGARTRARLGGARLSMSENAVFWCGKVLMYVWTVCSGAGVAAGLH